MIKKLLKFISIENQAIPSKDKRFYLLMEWLTFSSMVICLFIGSLVAALKFPTFITVVVFITAVLCALLFLLNRRGKIKIAFYALIYILVMFCFLANVLLGWQGGVYLYLFILIPTIQFNASSSRREKLIVTALYVFSIFAIGFSGFVITPYYDLTDFQLQFFNLANVLIAGLALGGISYYYFKTSESMGRDLLQANGKLEILARQDSLTGLLNRRGMNDLIDLEYERSQHSKNSFGLVMADIDNFKQVNDDFGHIAGDQVLIQIGRIFLENLRQQDRVARWGGEEFLMLLPETDEHGIHYVAEKLRQAISETDFSNTESAIRITVTLGGVECRPGDDWKSCVTRADETLYLGKERGKNLAVFSRLADPDL